MLDINGILDIKTNNNLDWFVMILINIFYSDNSRLLVFDRYPIGNEKIDKIIRIYLNDMNLKNFNKLIPIELLLIKFLRFEGKEQIIKMMSIKKNFKYSIRIITDIYELFGINHMNLYMIDDVIYKDLNKYYKYSYNYYSGEVDIIKTWKFEIGEYYEDFKQPLMIIVHYNFSENEIKTMREIIKKGLFKIEFEYDEFKDYIQIGEKIYKLETMIYEDELKNYFILFNNDKKGYSYHYGKKELKRFEWNSRVYMYKSFKTLMCYI